MARAFTKLLTTNIEEAVIALPDDRATVLHVGLVHICLGYCHLVCAGCQSTMAEAVRRRLYRSRVVSLNQYDALFVTVNT